ncbi:GLI pathogenesis-related 2, like isoform X2 [Vanacampus margaritifer]
MSDIPRCLSLICLSASKQFAEEVLQCHNEYRKKHQAPALKLSSNLSKEAARYAESLASTRILKHSEESSRGSCGENLAWASYDQTGKDVADRWYDEVKQYNFSSPGFSSGTGENGHFMAISQQWCGRTARGWVSVRPSHQIVRPSWWLDTLQLGISPTKDTLRTTSSLLKLQAPPPKNAGDLT